VTDPADLTHDVLRRVAEFLRTLPADRLVDLARGDATLALVPPPAPAERTPPALSTPAEEVRAALSSMDDRASAARYLDDLRLTGPQLRALAKELGLAVPAKAAKVEVRNTIVQWTVGRRLDASILSRPSPHR
jgi:hypothetical protein